MASSTIFSGVKITWFGHSSFLLEGDGLAIYLDPFVLPRGSKPADAILYSHGHHDHCVAAPAITTSRTVLLGHGCNLPVRVIEIGAKERLGAVTVEAVDAYNIAKPYHPKGAGAGFIIRFKTASVYFAGDTDNIPEMKGYKCDVAILPMGGIYTMDAREAAAAAEAIMPKLAIPMHYNYLSDTRADPEVFRAEVERRTGGKVAVRVLEPQS